MIKRLFITVVLLIVFLPVIKAQEKEVPADTVLKADKVIPVAEITIYSEQFSERFVTLRDKVKPSSEMLSVAGFLDSSLAILSREKDVIYSDTSDISYRKLEFLLNRWLGYKKRLEKGQEVVQKRSKELQDVSSELNKYHTLWYNTKQSLLKQKGSDAVIKSIDNILSRLDQIMVETNNRTDSLFIIQKKLSDLSLLIDEVIQELLIRQQNLQSRYFIIESPPIWKTPESYTAPGEIFDKVVSQISSELVLLGKYLKYNLSAFFLFILWGIVLLILFLKLKRKWLGGRTGAEPEIGNQTRVILQHPVSSALILAILTGVFFFSDRPPVFGEILSVIVLLSTLQIIPGLSLNRFKFVLVVVFLLMILSLITNYFGIVTLPGRLSNIAGALVLSALFFDFLFNPVYLPVHRLKYGRLIRGWLIIYLILVLMSVAANIVGAANLSDFLYAGSLYSTIFGFVAYATVQIFTTAALLLTRKSPEIPIQTLSKLGIFVQQHVRKFAGWAGFLLWLYLTLISFNVVRYVKNLLVSMSDVSWKIGQITVSVGGLLAFIIIVVFTFLISRGIKNVLREDWILSKGLPKGSSAAVSIVLRIIVVTIGLYFAAGAAGINLTQLGFILGALSVGIGFGLQSVVLNFIAGLILAFERPVNIGDAIEVDQEYGVVTEIGVRASKVRTYDGTEVIIPNGDLISKKVKNYTLTDEKRRFKILFRTSLDADPKKVIDILTRSAASHPNTLEDPSPSTLFWGYGDTALEFYLYFWTEFKHGLHTRSEVMLAAHENLTEAGIKVAIPIRKMQIDDLPAGKTKMQDGNKRE